MIRAALGRGEAPAPYIAPEPFSRADREMLTEAYAVAQAERHATRRRHLREAIARRIPAQKSGDSMAGLETPKKAC